MAKENKIETEINEIKGEPNKHLTERQRMEIQDCPAHGVRFKDIGKRIGKNQTTVSREVKQHLSVQPARSKDSDSLKPCPLLLKAPFVCNGCDRRSRCRLERHFYYARVAHQEYSTLLTEARSGIALGKEQFYTNDALLKEGIEKGQHVYHIVRANQMNVSIASVYRYIHAGYSAVSLIDLPRAVKFKPRKQKPKEIIPSSVKRGRTYDCFQDFITNHAITQWLEMDTVIGRPGGKVLLTFATTDCNFMFARLADDKTAVSISKQIRQLKETLSLAGKTFGHLFPVVLTDNGGEFANAASVEMSLDGQQESHLFFCDPYASYQKPHVGKGHTLLRDILPSGSSFDGLSQEQVDLVFSHINGVLRSDLGGKSSFDVFSFMYSAAIANCLGIQQIYPSAVLQSPVLLK